MEMFHLTSNNCYICAARTVVCRRPWRHLNGSWQEYREYECGLKLEFVPNFNSQREIAHCPQDGKYSHIESNRLAAITKLQNLVNSLEVDDEFKKAADRHIGDLKLFYTK